MGRYEVFFDSGIIKNEKFHRTYDLVKNLSYNVQYIEFVWFCGSVALIFFKRFLLKCNAPHPSTENVLKLV